MTDLHDLMWREALRLYRASDPGELARLIRGRTPAPTDTVIADQVCALVADVVDGREKVSIKRGPRSRVSVPLRFKIKSIASAMRRDGVAEKDAIEWLSSKFNLAASSVREVIGPRSGVSS